LAELKKNYFGIFQTVLECVDLGHISFPLTPPLQGFVVVIIVVVVVVVVVVAVLAV